MIQLGVGASAVKTVWKYDQILSRCVRQAKSRQFLSVVQRHRAGDVILPDSGRAIITSFSTAAGAAETAVPTPVDSLSLHTHGGCISMMDRENQASAVEFRNYLADLWTQTHRMVTERFSLQLGSGFVDKE